MIALKWINTQKHTAAVRHWQKLTVLLTDVGPDVRYATSSSEDWEFQITVSSSIYL